MKRLAAAILFALAAQPVAAESLVITLSSEEVMIGTNFTGTRIAVFGAVVGAPPAALLSAYDIVAVLQGPPETAVARRKDAVLGLWINGAEVTFVDAPEFYAVKADRPLPEIADPALLAELRIGLDNLALATPPAAAIPDDVRTDFVEAFVRLKSEEGHYYEDDRGVATGGAGTFIASFDLPADVPDGTYTVAVYLFRDGKVLAVNARPFAIAKTGAEQYLFDASRQQSWLYGLAVVAMAVAVGWLGSVIFRKE